MTKGKLIELLAATRLPNDAEVLFCWPEGDEGEPLVAYRVEREDDHDREECFARVYLEERDPRLDHELSRCAPVSE
jgi:hypothetical protein